MGVGVIVESKKIFHGHTNPILYLDTILSLIIYLILVKTCFASSIVV